VESNQENVAIVHEVAAVLDRLEIPYAVGGSWARSLLGKPRLTHDVNVTVEPFPGKETAFCSSFSDDYYVSVPMIQDAVRRRSSFNIIHWPSGFKIDIFVRKNRPYDASVLARRRLHPLSDGRSLTLVSPEDVILLKLEWYRLGGNTSERQLEDVRGVFQMQAGNLDQAYLDHWAADLSVSDLLQRARQESGV
jgi:hypothetical protein